MSEDADQPYRSADEPESRIVIERRLVARGGFPSWAWRECSFDEGQEWIRREQATYPGIDLSVRMRVRRD